MQIIVIRCIHIDTHTPDTIVFLLTHTLFSYQLVAPKKFEYCFSDGVCFQNRR